MTNVRDLDLELDQTTRADGDRITIDDDHFRCEDDSVLDSLVEALAQRDSKQLDALIAAAGIDIREAEQAAEQLHQFLTDRCIRKEHEGKPMGCLVQLNNSCVFSAPQDGSVILEAPNNSCVVYSSGSISSASTSFDAVYAFRGVNSADLHDQKGCVVVCSSGGFSLVNEVFGAVVKHLNEQRKTAAETGFSIKVDHPVCKTDGGASTNIAQCILAEKTAGRGRWESRED